MSKRTLRKSLNYIKKEYIKTRTMQANWYLSNYRYKFNITHHQPFLKKLKDKKVVGNKCPACNRVFFPPRFVCGKCLVKPDQWVDLRDTGQVSTYTIVYLKDPETGEVIEKPVIMVRQDSSDTNYLAELEPDINFRDTYIGMPIKIHWAESTNGNLKDIEYYDLIDDDSKDLQVSEE